MALWNLRHHPLSHLTDVDRERNGEALATRPAVVARPSPSPLALPILSESWRQIGLGRFGKASLVG
jgi:hypothetical protein